MTNIAPLSTFLSKFKKVYTISIKDTDGARHVVGLNTDDKKVLVQNIMTTKRNLKGRFNV